MRANARNLGTRHSAQARTDSFTRARMGRVATCLQRILHPAPVRAPNEPAGAGASPHDNDASCVLRVVGAAGLLLLTGDIGTAAEAKLIAASHRQFSAAVVVSAPTMAAARRLGRLRRRDLPEHAVPPPAPITASAIPPRGVGTLGGGRARTGAPMRRVRSGSTSRRRREEGASGGTPSADAAALLARSLRAAGLCPGSAASG